MKNVNKNELKTAICIELDRFRRLIAELSDNDIKVDYDFEFGISYETDSIDDPDTFVIHKLTEYFDVNVTSIHTDDYDPIGVWIVYKTE